MWDMNTYGSPMDSPLTSHCTTVGYDGQVGWDTYNVKLDDSPTLHSTVGHVGLKHMRVEWSHISHMERRMGYMSECSGQSHLSHIVEWDVV